MSESVPLSRITGVTRVWFDERGEAFTAPAAAETCSGRDGRTHYLFAPHDPWMLQAITRCGLRAGEIPGEGDVTCHECRDASD